VHWVRYIIISIQTVSMENNCRQHSPYIYIFFKSLFKSSVRLINLAIDSDCRSELRLNLVTLWELWNFHHFCIKIIASRELVDRVSVVQLNRRRGIGNIFTSVCDKFTVYLPTRYCTRISTMFLTACKYIAFNQKQFHLLWKIIFILRFAYLPI